MMLYLYVVHCCWWCYTYVFSYCLMMLYICDFPAVWWGYTFMYSIAIWRCYTSTAYLSEIMMWLNNFYPCYMMLLHMFSPCCKHGMMLIYKSDSPCKMFLCTSSLTMLYITKPNLTMAFTNVTCKANTGCT